MESLSSLVPGVILDSLGDGVYVCDTERRISYWSKSAERITGWRSEDIVGSHCFDGILNHIDKDGHPLCGKEHCPLHRSMVTGVSSTCPLIVFAQGKDGQRIPMQVSVAPIRNSAGEVIGGIETFQDVSSTLHDLERAKTIQAMSMQHDLPEDNRVSFSVHYIPHDIVGGDYYAIEQLKPDRYGLLLADVMGHGIAAALYTMHISSLWNRHNHLLASPAHFAATMNNELAGLIKGDDSFAAGLCGLIDLESRTFTFSGAGGPPGLLMHSDGTHEALEFPGMPSGVLEDAPYEEAAVDFVPGDRVLLFSDGAIEVRNAQDQLLRIDGLVSILGSLGYPESDIRMHALEERLLKYSNAIRLEDDLTFLEVRFNA